MIHLNRADVSDIRAAARCLEKDHRRLSHRLLHIAALLSLELEKKRPSDQF